MLYTALLGHPVAQSPSPRVYAHFAEAAGVEYAHLKVDLDGQDRLAQAVAGAHALGFCGLSVTVPTSALTGSICTA